MSPAPAAGADSRPTTGDRLRALAAGVDPTDRLGRRLGVDRRGLAAFRIVLATVLLADLLVLRLSAAKAFYTDAGAFPRRALAETYPAFASASLHALSGSLRWQLLLFCLTGIALLALLAGYRTRLATLLSLGLLASMHARNPLLVNGGDTIALSLLLFGLFLPLGSRWSVDARRRAPGGADAPDGREGDRYVSAASAALLCHFALIYAVNGALKGQSAVWTEGNAVARIFQLHEHTVLLGPALATAPLEAFLAATWAWAALLAAAPLLVALAGRARLALVAAFVCAQLGMAATMRLGAFPFVMIAALLAFAPSPAWNRLESVLASRGVDRRLERAADATAGRIPGARSLEIPVAGVWGRRRSRGLERTGRVTAAALVLSLLAVSVLWQVSLVEGVETPIDENTVGDGSWAFFAPNPPAHSRWFVVEATLADGSVVDLRDGSAVSFDRPPDAAETYPGTLWHRYGTEVRYADERLYGPLGSYLCDRSERDVESLTIYLVEQPVEPGGAAGEPTVRERHAAAC